MNCQCDRCKSIYSISNDTVVVSNTVEYPIKSFSQQNEGIEKHVCPYCRILICDFIEENIPLKRKGKYQTEIEKTDKIYKDYYDSLDDEYEKQHR